LIMIFLGDFEAMPVFINESCAILNFKQTKNDKRKQSKQSNFFMKDMTGGNK
jgi:hypothetical protein